MQVRNQTGLPYGRPAATILGSPLHPWVVFAIMPLFALANAVVTLGGGIAEVLTNPVALGLVMPLVV